MITLADALNEPLNERLFSDAAPQQRIQTQRRAVVVDTRTPLHPRTTYRVTLHGTQHVIVVERLSVVNGPAWTLGRAWARVEAWYRSKGARIEVVEA